MAKHVVTSPEYQGFIRLLSAYETGPFVVRWGGNEQDKLTEVLEDAQWDAMRDLHANTGAVFMIGLNLRARDPALAVQQVAAAMRFIPPEAILAFNIGNEPDSYTYRENDSAVFPRDYWSGGGGNGTGYFGDMAAYCEALAPLFMQHFGTTKIVSGPGLADNALWKDKQAKRYSLDAPLKGFASMITTHFYTHRSTSADASHKIFLSEKKLDLIHRRVRPWVRWATKARVPFRLEETNTLSIQGLPGASDTHAAGLFYIDYALTMVAANVSGINLHDSWCSAYSPIVFPALCQPRFADLGSCPDVCGYPDVPPLIRAPYYGMLFVQMAISGLPTLLTAGVEVEKTAGVVTKAHALVARGGDELRIVVVRKGGDAPQRLFVRVHGEDYIEGSLALLEAPEYTSYHGEVTIAGQQVDELGRLTGERVLHAVAVEHVAGQSIYVLEMPPASAGLLVVRRLRGGGAAASN
ncbi:hypothetical protein FOA52_000467 [Chlamydomonas sp. UWO 241]|nr:hypothetical protein FOA52_000467 [Chlamydomonas sp. UWO 241]